MYNRDFSVFIIGLISLELIEPSSYGMQGERSAGKLRARFWIFPAGFVHGIIETGNRACRFRIQYVVGSFQKFSVRNSKRASRECARDSNLTRETVSRAKCQFEIGRIAFCENIHNEYKIKYVSCREKYEFLYRIRYLVKICSIIIKKKSRCASNSNEIFYMFILLFRG